MAEKRSGKPKRLKPRNPNETRGSKPGERRGGRQKGQPNKPKIVWDKTINLSGTTPLEFMLSIMQNAPPDHAPWEIKLAWFQLRFEAAKSSAPYIHPRAQEKPAGLNVDEAARRMRDAIGAMDESVGALPARDDPIATSERKEKDTAS